jgi:hypothetical protein
MNDTYKTSRRAFFNCPTVDRVSSIRFNAGTVTALMRADQSAVDAINRPLQLVYN